MTSDPVVGALRPSRGARAFSSGKLFVRVTLVALALTGGACAAPPSGSAKLHIAAAPEDFKALGLGKEIEVREDGRRTPQSSDYFEWWYLDALLDDGTVAVIWFGDNWFYGSHKRAVTIELTPP